MLTTYMRRMRNNNLGLGLRAPLCCLQLDIENTSWKVLAYGIYARVVDVSEIERVSAANE